MSAFDATTRVALDRFSVPPLRPDFAAQVVAAATTDRPAPLRRDPRLGWRRRSRVLIGVGALVLASATAAASGLFGRLPNPVPALTHVFAHAVPVAPPAPDRKAVLPHKGPVSRGVNADPVAAPPPTILLAEPRAAIRDRLIAIRAARIAAGEPVRPLPIVLRPRDDAQIARRRAFLADRPMVAARMVERFRDRQAARLADVKASREAVPIGDLAVPSAHASPEPLADDRPTGIERWRALRRLRERRRAMLEGQ